MSLLFAAFFRKFGSWIIAIGSACAAAFIFWRSSISVGKADAKADYEKQKTKDNEAIAVKEIDAARDVAKKEVSTMKGASDAKANVISLDSGAAADKLRSEWSRD